MCSRGARQAAGSPPRRPSLPPSPPRARARWGNAPFAAYVVTLAAQADAALAAAGEGERAKAEAAVRRVRAAAGARGPPPPRLPRMLSPGRGGGGAADRGAPPAAQVVKLELDFWAMAYHTEGAQ